MFEFKSVDFYEVFFLEKFFPSPPFPFSTFTVPDIALYPNKSISIQNESKSELNQIESQASLLCG